MWIQYSIPSTFKEQKQIIRKLRKWIQDLEQEGVIRGFAFNHYSSGQDQKNHLGIRFDFPNGEIVTVTTKLQKKIRQSIPGFTAEPQLWDSKEVIRSAYELGSRCAFLLWEKGIEGRVKEEYLTDYTNIQNRIFHGTKEIPLNFQFHLIHGFRNSIGISKKPNEEWLNLIALIESTKCSSPEELCNWIKKQPLGFFKYFRKS